LKTRGSGLASVAADMVQVFSADSVDRLTHAAKNALSAVAAPDPTAALQTLHKLLQHPAIDTIAARRRIADAIIDAQRYPL
jgi:hypothetical protein